MCALSVTCILSTLQNPIHVMSTNCVLYFMPTLISIALFEPSTGEEVKIRHVITKTCPCNMQQCLKVEKMIIFNEKF